MVYGTDTSFLLMLGTVHRDPKGYGKLLRFLAREQPAFITVEVSPYARAFRAKHSKTFRALLRNNLRRITREEGQSLGEMMNCSAIQGIFFLLKEPYEWRAAGDYAGRHNVFLGDIDLSAASRIKLARLPEIVALENLRTLLHVPFPDLSQQVDSQYRRARFLFSHPPSVWPKSPEEKEREAYMAQKIRTLIRRAGGKKVIHIGGWEHLVDFPREESFIGLLKELRPQRVLLEDELSLQRPSVLSSSREISKIRSPGNALFIPDFSGKGTRT